MNIRSIETIFFDWDHTLAYTKTPNNTFGERLAMMFRIAGLPYTQEQIERAVQQYVSDAGQDKVRRFIEAQTRRDITNFYTHLLDYLGHENTTWELLVRIYGAYSQLPWYIYDDSRVTLQTVRDKGYVVCILSNTSRSARQNITQMVGDIVPARNIIISEEIGVHKPAKTIFRRAAAQVHTPPENCMMVGDNLVVDAFGAVQNGGYGYGVWLDRKQQNDGRLLPANIATITSLTQLIDLL
jgi:HAD superfamily hydrolase (TIGR01549 family)